MWSRTRGSSQLCICWNQTSSFISQVFLPLPLVFHAPGKYFVETPTNPHMFSWTNLLTLIQSFCPLLLFWFHLPLTPAFTYEAALLSDAKMPRSVLKVWRLAAQKAISPPGQGRPGIHEGGVVNRAPPLGGTLSPGHWNSPVYGQHFEKNRFCL